MKALETQNWRNIRITLKTPQQGLWPDLASRGSASGRWRHHLVNVFSEMGNSTGSALREGRLFIPVKTSSLRTVDKKAALMEIFEMKARLRNKVDARDILNLEILHLQEKIRAMHKRYLTVVLAEERKQYSSSGLTDAIKNILQKHENPMTASEVRLGLEAIRFPLKRFKNPSAAVKTTLIRLSKAGELIHDEKENWYDLPKRL